jgi:hypothetical protein
MLVFDLNWFVISDWFEQKTCKPHRQYGGCCCCNRRGNPCERTQNVADACKALGFEEQPGVDLDEIIVRAKHHKCKTPNCNHRACIEAERVIEWLYNYKGMAATLKKAA